MKIEFHPVSEIFPLMNGEAFSQLVADVKANGLREAIWRHENKIIDGRNRYRACGEAGVEPRFQEWDGNGSLVAFVVSLNLHRRHLDESQRAMVAAKIANLDEGNPHLELTTPIGAVKISQSEAAEMLNVGRRSVSRAKSLQDHGIPELIESVEQGRVTLFAAQAVSREDPQEQKRIIAEAEVVSIINRFRRQLKEHLHV